MLAAGTMLAGVSAIGDGAGLVLDATGVGAVAGVPLNVVAANLGHADTRMTEKHYAHMAPSYVAEQLRKFAPTFGTAEPANVVTIERARG